MSTIPDGLRADLMRARMEDKATITAIGGLYVGGTNPINYVGSGGSIIPAYETECLPPGTSGYPLVSNGAGEKPSYKQVTNNGIEDEAVTGAKLGQGTIVALDGTKKYVLDISASNRVLNISFTPLGTEEN